MGALLSNLSLRTEIAELQEIIAQQKDTIDVQVDELTMLREELEELKASKKMYMSCPLSMSMANSKKSRQSQSIPVSILNTYEQSQIANAFYPDERGRMEESFGRISTGRQNNEPGDRNSSYRIHNSRNMGSIAASDRGSIAMGDRGGHSSKKSFPPTDVLNDRSEEMAAAFYPHVKK